MGYFSFQPPLGTISLREKHARPLPEQEEQRWLVQRSILNRFGKIAIELLDVVLARGVAASPRDDDIGVMARVEMGPILALLLK